MDTHNAGGRVGVASEILLNSPGQRAQIEPGLHKAGDNQGQIVLCEGRGVFEQLSQRALLGEKIVLVKRKGLRILAEGVVHSTVDPVQAGVAIDQVMRCGAVASVHGIKEGLNALDVFRDAVGGQEAGHGLGILHIQIQMGGPADGLFLFQILQGGDVFPDHGVSLRAPCGSRLSAFRAFRGFGGLLLGLFQGFLRSPGGPGGTVAGALHAAACHGQQQSCQQEQAG